MSKSKFSCPHLTVVQWNADVPGVYYKPVLLAPLNLKLGDNSDALPLANSIARACNSHEQLVALLVESQDSIGGDWRERRDAIIAKITGAA